MINTLKRLGIFGPNYCLVGLVLSLFGLGIRADVAAAEPTTKPVHGIAIHGDVKYPPDFKHFDYADPTAPKGGTLQRHTTGTFDSFNGFIIKGNPAAGLGFIYDSLMTSSMDEPASEYGQIAESIETPKDRSWVIFTLRKNARWHDGNPVTDVLH